MTMTASGSHLIAFQASGPVERSLVGRYAMRIPETAAAALPPGETNGRRRALGHPGSMVVGCGCPRTGPIARRGLHFLERRTARHHSQCDPASGRHLHLQIPRSTSYRARYLTPNGPTWPPPTRAPGVPKLSQVAVSSPDNSATPPLGVVRVSGPNEQALSPIGERQLVTNAHRGHVGGGSADHPSRSACEDRATSESALRASPGP